MSSRHRWPSLVHLIRDRGQLNAGERAYTWLTWSRSPEPTERAWTWDQVAVRARAIGAVVQRRAQPGNRVLIAAPMRLEYISAVLGALMAGAVIVPLMPPIDPRSYARIIAVLEDAEPALALTSEALAQSVMAMPEFAATLPVPWIGVDAVPDDAANDWVDPQLGPEDLALLQYTSGSTAAPKGVMVRHGDLLANLKVIYDRFGHRSDSIGLHWLPLFHDMGLIGGVLQPLWIGCANYHMDPYDFVRRPERWLHGIGRYQVTTAGGPNFAYQLCVDRVPEHKRQGLDLRCWEVAFCGAEPVRTATMTAFADAFAPWGFNRRALYPCYGMAESTLYATGGEG